MYDREIRTLLCVVGEDSSGSPSFVREAADFARLVGAEEMVLFTVARRRSDPGFDGPTEESEERAVARAVVRLRELELRVEPAPFRFTVHASVGDPCQEIQRAAASFQADLVVLESAGAERERPARQRSPRERTVAEDVVRESERPVLVLRGG